MIGPIVDSASLAIGGIAGAFFGNFLPKRIKETMPLIFGVITISIGVAIVEKVSYLPAVVMALLVGSCLGELFHMERGLETALRKTLNWTRSHDTIHDENYIIQYVTLISAFCFGSMGFFGAVHEGMTGSPEILLTKAIMDIFSGIIFGATLGITVSFIAIPQFIILAGLYLSSGLLMPFVTTTMLNDFSACGGVIFLATGLRLCHIKIFPVINMMPSLVLVFFFSAWWEMIFQ